MNKEKIKAYIGFAVKSGSIFWGGDNILNKKNISLILIDSELNETALNRLIKYAEEKKTEYKILEKGLIEELTGRINCKAIGIKNSNLSGAIKINL